MNNIYYPLEVPKETIVTSTIYKFTITNINIILFDSVSMTIMSYDENDKLINGEYLCMNGQEYLNWNNDDQYLIDWVHKQISKDNI